MAIPSILSDIARAAGPDFAVLHDITQFWRLFGYTSVEPRKVLKGVNQVGLSEHATTRSTGYHYIGDRLGLSRPHGHNRQRPFHLPPQPPHQLPRPHCPRQRRSLTRPHRFVAEFPERLSRSVQWFARVDGARVVRDRSRINCIAQGGDLSKIRNPAPDLTSPKSIVALGLVRTPWNRSPDRRNGTKWHVLARWVKKKARRWPLDSVALKSVCATECCTLRHLAKNLGAMATLPFGDSPDRNFTGKRFPSDRGLAIDPRE